MNSKAMEQVGAANLLVKNADTAGAPVTVTFQVTDRCNYECVHCYQEHVDRDELSFEEVSRILGEIADLGVLFLTLVGGEFFMRPDANKILQRAHDLGFAIKLLSTGHHIHEKRADFLRTIRPLQVDLSLYGASKDKHEAVTDHPGSWERTIAAAKRLIERDIPVQLKAPVMEQNAAEINDLTELASSMGALFSADAKITTMEDAGADPVWLRMRGDTLQTFYRDKEKGIATQLEVLPRGGTDTAGLQRHAAGGSIAGGISIPCRYLHQVIEMASKSDLRAGIDLLKACLQEMGDYDWSHS